MSSVSLRRAAAVAAALTATVGLSACGTGMSAQTNQQYQAGIGANLRTGPMLALNTLFVDNGDGTATLSTAFVNKSESQQELQGVTVTVGDNSPATAEPSSAVFVSPGGSRSIGAAGEIVVQLDSLTAGAYADVVLTFDKTGDIEIEAPVVERNATYDDVATAPGGATTAESGTATE